MLEQQTDSPRQTTPDLLGALLEADPELGTRWDELRSVTMSMPVRRAIVEQRQIKPTLRHFRLLVNYDDPAHRDVRSPEYHGVNSALTAANFPIVRTGQNVVDFFEIVTDCTMNVAGYRRLIRLLGFRRPCLAESRTAINRFYHQTETYVMALCGQPFSFSPTDQRLPALLKIRPGRIIEACRSNQRYSHEYRLLAVAGGVTASV